MIIALSAIIAAIPKETINRELVRKNISNLQVFDGIAGKQEEVKIKVAKLVDLILGLEQGPEGQSH